MNDDLKERLRPPGRSVVSKCDDVDGTDLSNAPLTYERIWLQAGDAEVTWCQHSQDDEDVPYVRADFYAATIARITDLEARLSAVEAGEDALAKVTDAYKEMLATVEGECPSLVNEDSGASQVLLNLMLAAERALAAYEARRKG